MVLIFYGGYAHVVIASYAGKTTINAGKRNKLGMIKILASRIHPTARGKHHPSYCRPVGIQQLELRQLVPLLHGSKKIDIANGIQTP